MEPLTNNICKAVAALDERKHRRREGAFKAEGTKCVLDTIGHFNLRALYATQEWLDEHPDFFGRRNVYIATRGDMRKMSSLTTPGQVIAVYDIPERTPALTFAEDTLILALDTIQDPGNLGTIIRVADWYGITDIIASRETADCFAPKVIQATMGSISRVNVHVSYTHLRAHEPTAGGVCRLVR
ncbi:MAG: RNA methyltransferase, partial [Duncaniella sp.]|nr:RNA methyltransferase [Duncaniella sp.]